MLDEQPTLPASVRKDRTTPRSGWWRRFVPGVRVARGTLIVLGLLGLLFSVVPQGRAALRAALLLPSLIGARQPGATVALSEPIRHSSVTLTAQGGPVYLTIYQPAGPAPVLSGGRQGIVLISGVGANQTDPQLINLLETFARSGIVIANLTTDALQSFQLTPRDGDGVVRAVQALQHWPGVDPQQVGIFGLSAGGALATIAAADARVRDQLAFITLFGGYYDARSLLRDFGQRAQLVDGVLSPWQPNIVPVQVLADSLGTSIPTADAATIAQSFSNQSPLSGADIALLAPGSAAAYHLLAGDQPGNVDANLAALTPATNDLLDALSPATYAAQIHTHIYLLHDRNDQYVPFTQSRAFDARLTALGFRHDFVEFNIFAHVEVKSGLDITAILGDGSRLYGLLFAILNHGA